MVLMPERKKNDDLLSLPQESYEASYLRLI